MAAAKATTAAAWRSKPELVELPSGKRAHLRAKLNVYAALRSGVLTSAMLDDFYAVQRGELDDPARAVALQDALVCWLFTEPRCVAGESVPQGALHISDLDDEDLDFLIERALGGASEGASFPEPARAAAPERGDARAPGDGAAVGDEPERPARARGGDAAGLPDRPPPRARRAQSRAKPAGGRAGKH